jgi:hypothetical protein
MPFDLATSPWQLMLHMDNATAQPGRESIECRRKFRVGPINHPEYCPDLAPPDFYLFGKLKLPSTANNSTPQSDSSWRSWKSLTLLRELSLNQSLTPGKADETNALRGKVSTSHKANRAFVVKTCHLLPRLTCQRTTGHPISSSTCLCGWYYRPVIPNAMSIPDFTHNFFALRMWLTLRTAAQTMPRLMAWRVRCRPTQDIREWVGFRSVRSVWIVWRFVCCVGEAREGCVIPKDSGIGRAQTNHF